MHEKAFCYGIEIRQRAINDMIFYWITQWDDNLLSSNSLEYKGEFNILRKAGRQIMSEMKSNPVQIEFETLDEEREDDLEIVDGMFRTSVKENSSIESFENASMEMVVAGVGSWEIITGYEKDYKGNKQQVVKRKPIHESAATLFWDPNAKMLDKSDAGWCSLIVPYSYEGYKEEVKRLTGKEIDEISVSSFATPDTSYTFPWIIQNELVYIVKFWHIEDITKNVYDIIDPMGEELTLDETAYNDFFDMLEMQGYELIEQREIECKQVRLYYLSGQEILTDFIIPGENIPVITAYGERAFVEGVENYEGITKLAKDPSRLRNFQMSYLADIVSRSPRPKPIFTAEQIAGFEFMYQNAGAENNYPYYLVNRVTHNGEPLPIGPIAQMPEQEVPKALIESITLTRESVDDVASAGLPRDFTDTDIAYKTVLALQNRIDQQTVIYQEHIKHAKRRDAIIFASMAGYVYDTKRKVVLTKMDDSKQHVTLMESALDAETGKIKTKNDITNLRLSVSADIGPNYQTKRLETIDRLEKLMTGAQATNPTVANILMLKILKLMNGVDFEDIRDYANKQLIIAGVKQPETDEEKQMLMQAQQNQKPDAATLLAQAEMQKAQAAQMREQRQAAKDQADNANHEVSNRIDAFEAETGRLKVQVDAQKADAELKLKQVDTFNKQVQESFKAYRGTLQ